MKTSEGSPLDNAFTEVKSHLANLEYKERYVSKNRVELLTTHGFIGIGIGGYIGVKGGPEAFVQVTDNPHLLHLLYWVPVWGGFLLLLGLILSRNKFLEGAGMTALLTWDLWMTYIFYIAQIYPVVLYAGLSVFMCIHLRTLSKLS